MQAAADINEARAVTQHALDRTGAALLSGDPTAFEELFHLPQTLSTMGGSTRLETVEELRAVVSRVHAHLRSLGVAKLDRRIDTALFDGPDTIRYSHISRLLDDKDELVQAPYPTLSRMIRIDGQWQIADTQYALRDEAGHDEALLGSRARPSVPGGAKSSSYAVFQGVLDRITRAYLTGDFDLLEQNTALPLFVQKSAGTEVFPDRERLLADFRQYQTEFSIHGITDIVRSVRHVELVGTRRMQGTYRTHILCGTNLLVPGYGSALSLEQGEDAVWRVTSIMHPMGHLTLDRIVSGELP